MERRGMRDCKLAGNTSVKSAVYNDDEPLLLSKRLRY